MPGRQGPRKAVCREPARTAVALGSRPTDAQAGESPSWLQDAGAAGSQGRAIEEGRGLHLGSMQPVYEPAAAHVPVYLRDRRGALGDAALEETVTAAESHL